MYLCFSRILLLMRFYSRQSLKKESKRKKSPKANMSQKIGDKPGLGVATALGRSGKTLISPRRETSSPAECLFTWDRLIMLGFSVAIKEEALVDLGKRIKNGRKEVNKLGRQIKACAKLNSRKSNQQGSLALWPATKPALWRWHHATGSFPTLWPLFASFQANTMMPVFYRLLVWHWA